MAQMLKPVYLKNSEIKCDERITDFMLLEHIDKVVGDNIKCIQQDRDLWRVYLNTTEAKNKLLLEGFDFDNQHLQVYEFNPYSSGTESPDDKVLKVTISGVPLSVDDNAILAMLSKLGAKPKSELRYEKIRHPVTKKMTSVLNGNRFIYIQPLDAGKSLPRISYCAGLKCKIYHKDQPSRAYTPLCTKCWSNDHSAKDCASAQCCRVCTQPGHDAGSEQCESYVKDQRNVIAFHGKDNILSNFYPCKIKVFGEEHKSSEHAFQLVKALRSGDLVAADRIRDAKSALEAKRIGDNVTQSEQWKSTCESVMLDVINAKAEQVTEFHAKLKSSKKHSVFAESTFDKVWGTALNEHQTIHTSSDSWPGLNKLGDILSKVATRIKKRPTSSNTPSTSGKTNTRSSVSQKNISDMFKPASQSEQCVSTEDGLSDEG